MTKYKAKPVVIDNIRFASKKEGLEYGRLKLLERAKVIRGLELQPEFPVWIKGIKCFVYKADFAHFENSERIITDVKGVKTPVYRLKKRCVEAYYGIKIREV